MTITTFPSTIATDDDVYAPQDDSHFLVEEMGALPKDMRVLDFCTGSGVIALAAANAGAASVTAVDLSARAAHCARSNAARADLDVNVVVGSFPEAIADGPYDVVLCNPPYVPAPADGGIPLSGPRQAWDASVDGRLVLDPLCVAAPKLLADNGTLLLVQSEFSGVDETLSAFSAVGMDAEVVARRTVPFGRVMHSRAKWLEQQGILAQGRRDEELVVIRGTRR